MKFVMKLVVILALLAGAGALWGWYQFTAPGPLSAPKTVLLPRGAGFADIAAALEREGVVRSGLYFQAVALASGQARRFKAGEYAFAEQVSVEEVIRKIASGDVVAHRFTAAEGLNVREVLRLLAQEPALEGDIPPGVTEGSLLPETYHFIYGDSRASLVARMQKGMADTLAQLWAKRKEGLPVSTPEEALVLASIVEKETGVKEERGRVAAVFVNRLRKGMRLQSDPTVAYGIELAQGGPLGRALTLADLQAPTPYNTYVIPALPPTPIANPGRASLEATLNPPDTEELYFVATGTGGHRFASTLEEHNRNVAAYRAAVAKQKNGN